MVPGIIKKLYHTTAVGLTDESKQEVYPITATSAVYSAPGESSFPDMSLDNILDALNQGYQYMGKATPTTNPGVFNHKVFYLASEEGTYSHFDNIEVSGLTVLKTSGSGWSKDEFNITGGGGSTTPSGYIGTTMVQDSPDTQWLMGISNLSLTSTAKIFFGNNAYIELDQYGFHFSEGIYSDSFVSAGGVGTNGGGGGAGELNDLADVEINTSTLASGDLLTYNGTKWVNIDRSSLVSLTAGTSKYMLSVDGTSIDIYTKAQVDAIVGAVYRPAGNASTVSELGSLAAANIGKVYNMTAAFTTTADFLEGAGKTFPAGTNVVIVQSGVNTYKYDVLSGFVDLSGYAQKVIGATNGHFAGLDSNGNLTDSGHSHADYVTALDTSGNYLTWTKNGTTNNITVPFATKATQDGSGNTISDYYVTKTTEQTITGAKTFSQAITLSGSTDATRRIYFGDSTHYLELDQYGFHFSHGVYSDDFVSAGGIGTGGGSGSVAYLNDLTDVTASSPSSGDLLSWNGSAWVNIAQSTITPDLSAYALKTGADTYDFLVNSLKFKNTGHADSYISADSGPGPVYYQHQRLKWTYSRTSGSISDPDVTESKYVAFLDDIPTSLKNPKALTFGSNTYDGSVAKTITASDLGALTSVAFSDLSTHPTTLSGYGITDAKIASGVITLGSNTITPLTSHQTVTLTGGTNNGTLKLTVGGTATDNIAVTGLGSLAYKSSLVANDIPDISGTYVTIATAQTVSGVKTFTGGIVMSGADIVLGNADHIDIGPVRLLYDSTAGCLRVTTNQTGNNAPIIGLYADGQVTAGGVGSSGGGGGYGVESITSNQDGTVDFHFTGGDVTTVDLNHEHPQYNSKLAESSQPSGGFLPDVVYELGTLTGAVTFALATAVSGQVNHYFWTFTAGSTAPTITWPTGITWSDGTGPTVAANKKYEISVLNGVAAFMEV